MRDPLFPEWTAIVGFVIGAFIGSFLNMVIYRLPRELSFNEPKRSFCPRCKHPLGAIDLMPIVSWLSTGGKCRYCKEPVSPRYLIVELLTGSLFAGVWYRTMSSAPDPNVLQAVVYSIFVAVLVAIIFIDAELFIIPDELNAVLLVLGLGYAFMTGHIQMALEGALLGWGLIWGVAFLGRLAFGKDAMGDGDVKMMRGVGALLGPALLLANFGIAVVLGLVGGIVGYVVMSRNKPAETAETDEGEPAPPTPIWVVLLSGVWYLLCLDVVALVVKPLDRWIASKLPQEILEEEDDWQPSATTIPFGPYLAAGALACVLFAAPIQKRLADYWDNATHNQPEYSGKSIGSGRTPVRRVAERDGDEALLIEGRGGSQVAKVGTN